MRIADIDLDKKRFAFASRQEPGHCLAGISGFTMPERIFPGRTQVNFMCNPVNKALWAGEQEAQVAKASLESVPCKAKLSI